jgi:hypothetical protein
MKHRFGIRVLALGLGVSVSAVASAQQPSPPQAEAAPAEPVAPQPSAAPAQDAPQPTANPSAPPDPPPAGDASAEQAPPPPVTLPPYVAGAPTPAIKVPPTAEQEQMIGPDTLVSRGKKQPARVRWRGTNVSWNHAVTTTAVGIGRDNIGSEGEQYTQGLSATLNYFLIEPKDSAGKSRGYSLRVATSLAFDVELTDSDVTNTKHEPQMRDIPLSFVLSKPLWTSENKEWALSSAFNASGIFPTSPVSRGQGMYFAASPRASVFLQVPVLGNKSSFLKNILVGGGVRYDHRFMRATVPTNPDLERPRQATTGQVFLSDQLSGGSVDADSFRWSTFAFLGEKVFGGDLWASVGVGMAYQFLNEFGTSGNGCDVTIATGCAQALRQDDASTTRYATSFGVSVSYFPTAEFGVSLGYDNVAGQLGLDGKRRNFFYSPDAQFSASVVVSPDAIYERITGPARDEPVIYFGSNKSPKSTKAPPPGAGLVF